MLTTHLTAAEIVADWFPDDDVGAPSRRSSAPVGADAGGGFAGARPPSPRHHHPRRAARSGASKAAAWLISGATTDLGRVASAPVPAGGASPASSYRASPPPPDEAAAPPLDAIRGPAAALDAALLRLSAELDAPAGTPRPADAAPWSPHAAALLGALRAIVTCDGGGSLAPSPDSPGGRRLARLVEAWSRAGPAQRAAAAPAAADALMVLAAVLESPAPAGAGAAVAAAAGARAAVGALAAAGADLHDPLLAAAPSLTAGAALAALAAVRAAAAFLAHAGGAGAGAAALGAAAAGALAPAAAAAEPALHRPPARADAVALVSAGVLPAIEAVVRGAAAAQARGAKPAARAAADRAAAAAEALAALVAHAPAAWPADPERGGPSLIATLRKTWVAAAAAGAEPAAPASPREAASPRSPLDFSPGGDDDDDDACRSACAGLDAALAGRADPATRAACLLVCLAAPGSALRAAGAAPLAAATLQLLPLVAGRAVTAVKRGGRSEAVAVCRLLAAVCAALAAAGAGHAVAACGAADVLAHAARAALLDAVLRREAPEAVDGGGGGEGGGGPTAAARRRRRAPPWAALPRSASAASLAEHGASCSSAEDDSSDGGRRRRRGGGSSAGSSQAGSPSIASSASLASDDDDAADGVTWSECGSPPRRSAAAAARRVAARAARSAARRETVVAGAEYELLDVLHSIAALCGRSLALDCGVVTSGLLSVAAAAAPPAWDGGGDAGARHAAAAKAALARVVLSLLDSLGWEFRECRRVELWLAAARVGRALAPRGAGFRCYAGAMTALRSRANDGEEPSLDAPPDEGDPLAAVGAAAAALVRLFRSPTPTRRAALALASPGHEVAAAAARLTGHLVGCAHYGCVELAGASEAAALADSAAGGCACPDCGGAAYCSPACRATHAPEHAEACGLAARAGEA